MVIAGSGELDVGILNFLGDVLHVDAGGAQPGAAPDIDLAGVGQANGEIGVTADGLDIVCQFLGNGHHMEAGLNGSLQGVSVVQIQGNKGRSHEHQDEHCNDDDGCDDSQRPVHEVQEHLLGGGYDLLDGHGVVLVAVSEQEAEQSAGLFLFGLFLIAHIFSSFHQAFTRIRGSTKP